MRLQLTEGYHYTAALLRNGDTSGSSKMDADSAKAYGTIEIVIEKL